jgi:hypothetical protein
VRPTVVSPATHHDTSLVVQFLAWLDTNPKDVGGTTRRTLFLCKRGAAQTAAAAAAGEGGAPVAGDADAGVEQTKAKAKATIAPFAGGEWDFDRNPGNGANGRCAPRLAVAQPLGL